MIYDCVIIGGGPAGLNAALVLGRSRRKIALVDANQPRNAVTHASHGYLTQDGVSPSEFRRIAYEEIVRYPTVEHHIDKVLDVHKTEQGFLVRTLHKEFTTKKLLVATGLKEILPDIGGIKEFYGKSVFYCPYCDGWEMRDRQLVVVSHHPQVFHFAKLLSNWSRDLLICTNGKSILTEEETQELKANKISVTQKPVQSFCGTNGQLEEVVWTDGTRTKRTGAFINPQWFPQLDFLKQIPIEKNDQAAILTDAMGKSTTPGLFAAGEATTGTPTQLIVAAAAGSLAATSINAELTMERFRI
ncbi:NAD(P)/FAD-dependent oxidoreductase [Planococcus shixiaomingii]|uniref:NAD(P)/FAD-dependent oxidoreductase n=1 Tax=Planococcus shixiaomingii TaxID=3058393 RepID=UPI002614F20F|nr:NAD(P)/FAD-dependent oxidoreductase [Planococcus sp. N022]WKA56545.1 NAD(P)/FAD-dependent oxidoreductase [Planococcus sp. N022]